MLSRIAYCGTMSGYVNFKERHLWDPRDHSDRDNEETRDDDHQNSTTFTSPRNDRPRATVAQSKQGGFQATRALYRYPRFALLVSPSSSRLESLQLASRKAVCPGRNFAFTPGLAGRSESAESAAAFRHSLRHLPQTRTASENHWLVDGAKTGPGSNQR